ncbi:SAM-dependent 23S rRNA m(1)G745 methyltransferase [Oleiphilus messinensis]|uniref:SAM-dependent 23S rRNA m(1)G745 methyltransferase n=1 Tax=Oleiphilus messinensis TaxID=141451 RepID=A0A1Y0IAQ7_9GAMM|nr:hypothetical protein [Oleiphilus messinensis]ARU57551.1 SAM-dependent 23S rRNA m(1)G745 methyltransferase [Oleiphilus messinensis]
MSDPIHEPQSVNAEVFHSLLSCPICLCELSLKQRQLVCLNGHSFDQAKQGYFNLLPVQQKKSRSPGDSKAMIAARRRFLQAGLYEPVATQVFNMVKSGHSEASQASDKGLVIADAGCGDGYYLNFLSQALRAEGSAVVPVGWDISKEAIVAASKLDKHAIWLVASNKQPPITPERLDVLLCLFGFPCYSAFKAVMRPGASLILVDPGPEHLIELRKVIYPTVKKSQVTSSDLAAESGFELISTSHLTELLPAIDKAQIQDLLTMTPHLYKAPYEGKQAAQQLESITLTLDVTIRHYRVI